jgi:hypothetical protein
MPTPIPALTPVERLDGCEIGAVVGLMVVVSGVPDWVIVTTCPEPVGVSGSGEFGCPASPVCELGGLEGVGWLYVFMFVGVDGGDGDCAGLLGAWFEVVVCEFCGVGEGDGVSVGEEEVIIGGFTGLDVEGASVGGMDVVLVISGGHANVQYNAPLQFNKEVEAQQPPSPNRFN